MIGALLIWREWAVRCGLREIGAGAHAAAQAGAVLLRGGVAVAGHAHTFFHACARGHSRATRERTGH